MSLSYLAISWSNPSTCISSWAAPPISWWTTQFTEIIFITYNHVLCDTFIHQSGKRTSLTGLVSEYPMSALHLWSLFLMLMYEVSIVFLTNLTQTTFEIWAIPSSIFSFCTWAAKVKINLFNSPPHTNNFLNICITWILPRFHVNEISRKQIKLKWASEYWIILTIFECEAKYFLFLIEEFIKRCWRTIGCDTWIC